MSELPYNLADVSHVVNRDGKVFRLYRSDGGYRLLPAQGYSTWVRRHTVWQYHRLATPEEIAKYESDTVSEVARTEHEEAERLRTFIRDSLDSFGVATLRNVAGVVREVKGNLHA